jgi:hypothetical protein
LSELFRYGYNGYTSSTLMLPIVFFSKTLEAFFLTKSIYEKELVSLVLSIKHWSPYLIRRRFTVYVDLNSMHYPPLFLHGGRIFHYIYTSNFPYCVLYLGFWIGRKLCGVIFILKHIDFDKI